MEVEFSELIGKIITKVVCTDNEVYITTSDCEHYLMSHIQDCCETVYLESVVGDINDVVGYPVLNAELKTNKTNTFGKEYIGESFTWTFYTIATIKGYVDLRFLGASNGYYSERVGFYRREHNLT